MSSFLDNELFDPGTVVVNPLITQTTTIQIVLGQGQRLFDIDIENLVVKQCDGMKIIKNIGIVNTNRTKLQKKNLFWIHKQWVKLSTKDRLNFYTQSLRENPHNLFEVVVFFLDVLHFFGDGLGTYVVRNFEKTSWYTP